MYQSFLTFLLVVTAVSSIKIIPEGDEALVETFGKYERKKLEPGLRFLIPFVEQISYQETLREQIFNLLPQQCKTRDLATVTVEFTVYWRILNLEKACYKVHNFKKAMLNVLIFSIQTQIAKLTVDDLVDELYGDRNQLNNLVVQKLQTITAPWGLKITRVELRDFTIGTQAIQQRDKYIISQPKSESSSILTDARECLVNLLTLVIITMFLAAIVLPSFLNSANKAKQSEAKQYVSSMNRAQQAKFAENSAFSNSISALGIGIKTETNNYKYSIFATQTAAFNYGVSKHRNLKDYVGGVFVVREGSQITTEAIICESTTDTIRPAEPIYQNGSVICGEGTTELTR
jgi:type II secretory pathway pseudopilin PulG